MEIRPLELSEIDIAVQLIWDVFMQFEAPDYMQEGIDTFWEFIHNREVIASRQLWGAFDEDTIVGAIVFEAARSHINCFFVKAGYQKQGIGKKLWESVKNTNSVDTVTVNSSPYAVEIYHKLGFEDTDCEQLRNGIRYTPMIYHKV